MPSFFSPDNLRPFWMPKRDMLLFVGKWLLLSLPVGMAVGAAIEVFLWLLKWATDTREQYLWLVGLLPLAGWVIAWTYQRFGGPASKGNNLLLEEFYHPSQRIPLRMAPLILFGTIGTHLFGGSAGREGTAVQIGGSLADQLTRLWRWRPRNRRMLITAGISAGFAGAFGTPMAGAIFALEVMVMGRLRYESVLPSLFAAFVAQYTAEVLPLVGHTHYHIASEVHLTLPNLGIAVLAGAVFGLAGRYFSLCIHLFSDLLKRYISAPLWRPVAGGAIIALFVLLTGSTTYLGLGVPRIQEAFVQPLPWYDFLAKMLLTGLTLGAGFKGGEVTPLFFVGATLGNALSQVMGLPMDLLAGMGFVAVFAAAANTPLACLLMGLELFGGHGAMFIAIACFVAYFFSGHRGIYSAQVIGSPKHLRWGRDKGKNMGEVK